MYPSSMKFPNIQYLAINSDFCLPSENSESNNYKVTESCLWNLNMAISREFFSQGILIPERIRMVGFLKAQNRLYNSLCTNLIIEVQLINVPIQAQFVLRPTVFIIQWHFFGGDSLLNSNFFSHYCYLPKDPGFGFGR